jgi:hypothetical protein
MQQVMEPLFLDARGKNVMNVDAREMVASWFTSLALVQSCVNVPCYPAIHATFGQQQDLAGCTKDVSK